jgi:enoyl-CoA hydratase/carnithine racemase
MDGHILYGVTDTVAVITLNRPQRANAQTMEMLDDLDAAWDKAARDDEVKVIVLRANGKHFSFTGRAVTAREAEQIGMVNRVVALDRLQDETMELARHIAQMDAFALRQAKRAVNQTLDIQGFCAAIQSVFDIHHTGHGNAFSVGGYPILRSAAEMKEALKST